MDEFCLWKTLLRRGAAGLSGWDISKNVGEFGLDFMTGLWIESNIFSKYIRFYISFFFLMRVSLFNLNDCDPLFSESFSFNSSVYTFLFINCCLLCTLFPVVVEFLVVTDPNFGNDWCLCLNMLKDNGSNSCRSSFNSKWGPSN